VTDPIQLKEMAGNTPEWLIIEYVVFLSFLSTMLIILVKSRFSRVGADQQRMFDQIYLSFMIDEIVYGIDFDLL